MYRLSTYFQFNLIYSSFKPVRQVKCLNSILFGLEREAETQKSFSEKFLYHLNYVVLLGWLRTSPRPICPCRFPVVLTGWLHFAFLLLTGSSKFTWTIKVVPKPSDRARCSFLPSSHPGGVEVFWQECGNKNEVMGGWFQRTNDPVWVGWRAGKLSTVMYPHGKSYAEVRVKRFFPRPQSGMEARISVVSLAWRGNSCSLWL